MRADLAQLKDTIHHIKQGEPTLGDPLHDAQRQLAKEKIVINKIIKDMNKNLEILGLQPIDDEINIKLFFEKRIEVVATVRGYRKNHLLVKKRKLLEGLLTLVLTAHLKKNYRKLDAAMVTLINASGLNENNLTLDEFFKTQLVGLKKSGFINTDWNKFAQQLSNKMDVLDILINNEADLRKHELALINFNLRSIDLEKILTNSTTLEPEKDIELIKKIDDTYEVLAQISNNIESGYMQPEDMDNFNSKVNKLITDFNEILSDQPIDEHALNGLIIEVKIANSFLPETDETIIEELKKFGGYLAVIKSTQVAEDDTKMAEFIKKQYTIFSKMVAQVGETKVRHINLIELMSLNQSLKKISHNISNEVVAVKSAAEELKGRTFSKKVNEKHKNILNSLKNMDIEQRATVLSSGARNAVVNALKTKRYGFFGNTAQTKSYKSAIKKAGVTPRDEGPVAPKRK